MVTVIIWSSCFQMNWYTKRAALTGIYNTTELVMLQDSSPDFQDTWNFLDNRIQDMANMATSAKQVQCTVLYSHTFRSLTSLWNVYEFVCYKVELWRYLIWVDSQNQPQCFSLFSVRVLRKLVLFFLHLKERKSNEKFKMFRNVQLNSTQ